MSHVRSRTAIAVKTDEPPSRKGLGQVAGTRTSRCVVVVDGQGCLHADAAHSPAAEPEVRGCVPLCVHVVRVRVRIRRANAYLLVAAPSPVRART